MFSPVFRSGYQELDWTAGKLQMPIKHGAPLPLQEIELYDYPSAENLAICNSFRKLFISSIFGYLVL